MQAPHPPKIRQPRKTKFGLKKLLKKIVPSMDFWGQSEKNWQPIK
jgi:hypothetical protein